MSGGGELLRVKKGYLIGILWAVLTIIKLFTGDDAATTHRLLWGSMDYSAVTQAVGRAISQGELAECAQLSGLLFS